MKALTLIEPWATLIAMGHKTIETRSWGTSYRGPLAIHAGKSVKFLGEWDALWLVSARGVTPPPPPPPPAPSTWPLGQIIAVADLVDCFRVTMFDEKLGPKEYSFGDLSVGRYAWRLANVCKILPGIPARGFQQLWDVPPDVLAQILVAPAMLGRAGA